jgi:hypothetical protein
MLLILNDYKTAAPSIVQEAPVVRDQSRISLVGARSHHDRVEHREVSVLQRFGTE